MSADDTPPVIRTLRQVEAYEAIERAHAQWKAQMIEVLSMPYHEWVRRTFGPLGPMHYIDPRKDDATAAFRAAAFPSVPESEKSVKCGFVETDNDEKSNS